MSLFKETVYLIPPTGLEFQPDITDKLAWLEIEKQRLKWNKFLQKNKADIWNDEELWHHRLSIQKEQRLPSKKINFALSAKARKIRKLKYLIRGGVPPELRGSVWWASSAASKKRRKFMEDYPRGESYYDNLLLDAELQRGTQSFNDITKDLSRTFPVVLSGLSKKSDGLNILSFSGDTMASTDENSSTNCDRTFSSDDASGTPSMYTQDTFLEALQRVLIAYSLHNPRVGYCQSMNYICALLLFHVREEEKVFWMLAVIVEEICSNYYLPSFIGVRSDNLVFQALLSHYYPKLFAKIKSTDTLLEPIIMPWFLCLYINALPDIAVCRVWDCIFWQGREVLFRVGLNLFNSKAALIQQQEDFASIYCILKSENMGSGNSFQLESAGKKAGFSNAFLRRRTTSCGPLLNPRRIVSGYAFTFGFEQDESQDASDGEHLINSTFSKRLLFIRSKIRLLRYSVSEQLVASDRLARRLDLTSQDSEAPSRIPSGALSRPGSVEIFVPLSSASRSVNRYPSKFVAVPETVGGSFPHSLVDPKAGIAAMALQLEENSPEEKTEPALDSSPRPADHFVRITSRGVLTASFAAQKMNSLQRMSQRSESCFRLSSVNSSRASEKHLSLIR